MSTPLKHTEDQAVLSGAHQLEILMFRLESERDGIAPRVFGISVFKVRELLEVPRLTWVPGCAPGVAGVASIRGQAVPVINLCEYCGVQAEGPPKILLVSEFNGGVQGFLLHEVDGIVQLAWNDLKPPPDLLGEDLNAGLTAISLLEDERLLLILDVEKILADVTGVAMPTLEGTTSEGALDARMVFFVDDSSVAHAQVEAMLEFLGVTHQSATNGQAALEALNRLADQADLDGVPLNTRLQAIVTDYEMPIMDGHTLTQHIKQDPRFAGIPVMVHSSLSLSAEHVRIGMQMGADTYTSKVDPEAFFSELRQVIQAATDQESKAA